MGLSKGPVVGINHGIGLSPYKGISAIDAVVASAAPPASASTPLLSVVSGIASAAFWGGTQNYTIPAGGSRQLVLGMNVEVSNAGGFAQVQGVSWGSQAFTQVTALESNTSFGNSTIALFRMPEADLPVGDTHTVSAQISGNGIVGTTAIIGTLTSVAQTDPATITLQTRQSAITMVTGLSTDESVIVQFHSQDINTTFGAANSAAGLQGTLEFAQPGGACASGLISIYSTAAETYEVGSSVWSSNGMGIIQSEWLRD